MNTTYRQMNTTYRQMNTTYRQMNTTYRQIGHNIQADEHNIQADEHNNRQIGHSGMHQNIKTLILSSDDSRLTYLAWLLFLPASLDDLEGHLAH